MGASSSNIRESLHGQWSSRLAFILAVTGSAVGLGNMWKFPYIAGENGGGAFVLVYLLCVFLVGLPIMMSEVLLGRRGRRNPVATMAVLGEEEGGSRLWWLVGAVGVLAGFFILSFYSVIAGWSVAYIFESARGVFVGAAAESVNEVFGNLTSSWPRLALWHTVVMVMTVAVVARGVEKGLEKAVKFLVPALVGLMLVLLGYAMVEGDFAAGLNFLFRPDFAALTPNSVLVALGQAFFTLSIGMGAVMAYGAYLPEETSIVSTSATVVVADTSIALLAGLVIFPIVFANGLDPTQGPGLVFQTLPLAFGQMPGSTIVATTFFLLLTFAAWTSSIGIMEPVVAWAVESRGLARPVAATLVGIVSWVLGFGTIFSFNIWSNATFWRGTFFDNLDHFTSNILLPIGGLFITVFAGWIMSANSSAAEVDPTAGVYYRIWRLLARYVAPVAVVFVFLNAVGLFG